MAIIKKIVVLDGYSLNPGDLDWSVLEQYGVLKVYDRTKVDDIVARAADADVILTNKVPVSASIMEKLPSLSYIGVTATGYNIIDIEAAAKRGITVTNVPGYSTLSVVQLTFALLLELCHRVQRHSDRVMEGKWSGSPDFCFWDYPLTELAGKTMGIIGFGDIGKKVADVASAFGMNVIAYSRTQTDQSHRTNFRWVALDELFIQSDVVSIHCPLTPQTSGLINKDNLAKMKTTALLLNTSRGPVIVEEDLATALNEGQIAGAGLDVLCVEPPTSNNPLFAAKNCLITPHIAWATKEARQRLMRSVIKNLTAFLADAPENVVNRK